MKKGLFLFLTLICSISAYAIDWFPFKEVNHKWNLSLNVGYSPTGRVIVGGVGATVRGFHITIGGTGSTHEHDVNVDTWNEDASWTLHAGYQIPIVKSFRVIPVIGVIGVGEAHTNGYDWNYSHGQINNKVSVDMTHKFDYGAHLVFSHRKLIINALLTRHAFLGGIGLEF